MSQEMTNQFEEFRLLRNNRLLRKRRHLLLLVLLSLMLIILPFGLHAQQSPDNEEGQFLNEGKVLTQLNFLTSGDFPPFNYYDEDGNLIGFHIDLANAICRELSVRCEISGVEWDELMPTFERGASDAILAGLAVNNDNLSTVDFTRSYFRLPGRFAKVRSANLPEPSAEALSGYKIAVERGSAHEAYIRDHFKEAKLVSYTSLNEAFNALQKKEVDYIFADAVKTMFWINGALSKQCCAFTGGAYWSNEYFGQGLAIAIAKGNLVLQLKLNEALDNLRRSGQFNELMLRYFPLAIY